MSDQYKNVMIAIFVLAATSIVIFLMMFIHPSVGDERKVLKVRFSDIDKISIGTRVTYGGKPVGEVVDIKEIPEEKGHRLTRDGSVYLYELELRVDSSVNVFNSDEVGARTSGLLGEKSVSITPLPPKPGEKVRNIDNELIYASESGTVEQTFKEFKEVADKVDVALDNINRIMDDLQREHTFLNIARTASNLADISDAFNKPKEISEAIASVHNIITNADKSWPNLESLLSNLVEISDNIRDISGAVNQPDNISNTVENVHTLTEKAVKSWDTVDIALNDIADTSENTKTITTALNQPQKINNIIANLDTFTSGIALSTPSISSAISELSATATNTTLITSKISEGQGALGRILLDDELYLRIVSILNKGEVIFDDINHYGLLFQTDKGWQRLRARRMNLLAKLSTPQEFRNFFNDEVDNITTSLARVNMVLDKNESLYPCGLLLDDNEFNKVYAELLRRIAGTEEALKMYNMQLVESQLPRTELIYETELMYECPCSQ